MEKESNLPYQYTDREQNILQDLYEKRVMSTEQIKDKYFGTAKYSVNYTLSKMRNKKLIISNVLSGSRKGRKGYALHRISERGMEVLRFNGYPAKEDVRSLLINPAALPYILLANKVIFKLERGGWKYTNSRKAKATLGLDDGQAIKGILTDPSGKSYGLYVLSEMSQRKTIAKIQSEIRDKYVAVGNYLVYCDGEGSYDDFILQAYKPIPSRDGRGHIYHKRPLYTGRDLKIIKDGVSINILEKYSTEELWVKALSFSTPAFNILDLHADQSEQRVSFPILVDASGEKAYLADLTTSDITIACKVNNYSQHDYDYEKRPVLLVYCTEKQRALIHNNNNYIIDHGPLPERLLEKLGLI